MTRAGMLTIVYLPVFHFLQGLINMTTAWLRRLHRMLRAEAAGADPCLLQLQDRSATQCSSQHQILEATSLRHLLDNIPTFVSNLGQYAAAHARELVSDDEKVSPGAGDSTTVWHVSVNLQSAMRTCINRCMVCAYVAPALLFPHWLLFPHSHWATSTGIQNPLAQSIRKYFGLSAA